jgi:hypothetical protein
VPKKGGWRQKPYRKTIVDMGTEETWTAAMLDLKGADNMSFAFSIFGVREIVMPSSPVTIVRRRLIGRRHMMRNQTF